MGEAQMELGERELHKIGEFVKAHLPQWIGETGLAAAIEGGESFSALHKRELDLIERIVRVEDELKNLREVMEERFAKVDERFEALQKLIEERFVRMDERFETQQKQMDERFEAQQKQMDERFDHVEKRFEAQQKQIDDRFEAQQAQMDKRFTTLQWTVNMGFIILAALIGAPLFF